MGVKGQVISGSYGEILCRQKAGEEFELGELLVCDTPTGKVLLQVYDLKFASQLSQQNLELIAGMRMESGIKDEFLEPELRNYTIASLKALLTLDNEGTRSAKSLPPFFGTVREVTADDVKFLAHPTRPLNFGFLRSGSKRLNVPVSLDGFNVLTHHILITGTTGKGKSVLMKNLLWHAASQEYCAMLVLDPHDEYYGTTGVGLKDHENKPLYYTARNPPPGQNTLRINLKQVRPEHLDFLEFSPPQTQVMHAYGKKYKEDWVKSLLTDQDIDVGFNEASIAVVKRRLLQMLDLSNRNGTLTCDGIFSWDAGETTISDIANSMESGKTVIIDTSSFSGHAELLVGSLITTEVFRRYRSYKFKGQLSTKPAISVVLEEAPRVLGREVLEAGPNIFSTIAREGRKFNVGLVAITQLPSLIPREVLANMNTKIILGTEMNSERQAIIDSASQDLSQDSRAIAALDKGEAIISSTFAKFALPLSIPNFDTETAKPKQTVSRAFAGVKQ